uniref:Uncharacterized protein n=1 Tax=Arundo donax TaxID=35708 RepID=A0A0A8ZV93_ARUDO
MICSLWCVYICKRLHVALFYVYRLTNCCCNAYFGMWDISGHVNYMLL